MIIVNTSLRAGDVLNLKIRDVFDGESYMRNLWIRQEKTARLVGVTLLKCMITDLEQVNKEYSRIFKINYFKHPNLPLFPSQLKLKPLSYSTYLGLFKGWIKEIGLDPSLYGTHSLRSAIPSAFYFKTGDGIVASKLFGHVRLETTMVYLEEVAKMRALLVREKYHFDE